MTVSIYLLIAMPRTFRLLSEFEKGGEGFYTYGLEDRKNFINRIRQYIY